MIQEEFPNHLSPSGARRDLDAILTAARRGRFAGFLEFRDGRIVAQRSYDCFEPW